MSGPQGQYYYFYEATVSPFHHFDISLFHHSKQQTYTQFEIDMLIWFNNNWLGSSRRGSKITGQVSRDVANFDQL